MTEPVVVQNIFDMLGLPGVEELSAKAELAAKFIDVFRERGLSYEEAAAVIGTHASRVKMVCCADLDELTIDELCHWLVAMGQDVEIAVRSARDAVAHISVA